MGEVVYLADRLIPHWEAALQSAEIAREVAVRNLARLSLQASGQMELPYPSTIEGMVHPDSIARADDW